MKKNKKSCRGGTSILAMFFVSLFAMLAISFAGMGNINVMMSRNHRDVAESQAAAESGLEYASYLINDYIQFGTVIETNENTVSASEAEQTFSFFAAHVINTLSGSPLLNGEGLDWDQPNGRLTVPAGGGMKIIADNSEEFSLQFQFITGDVNNPHRMVVTSTGSTAQASRVVRLTFPILKDTEILEYAIASRGRMWITGDSTIHGDIFSGWDRSEISPFKMTSDSSVEGTINTVLARADIEDYHLGYDPSQYQMETLDENGNPMYDEEGNRIVGPDDFIQGYHEGINYEQPHQDMPGMSINDYNTDLYNQGLTEIASCPTDQREVEYFPHASGDFNYPRDGSPGATWNRRLERHVYEGGHFTDAKVVNNRNALFRNCTFDGVLYIDCRKSGTYDYNNVRFEDCTFNGPIVTDVPQAFKWTHNVLYFTGAATFQNNAMAEATILAPHFNVNLGNINPVAGENNVLAGAIVGGIVDIRGNAEVYGTIISMCDTTQWESGYVSNIGSTLGEGGNETTEPGNVGTISITPDLDNMLPSGIITPIVIVRDGNSYVEY